MWAWALLGQLAPAKKDPFQRPEVIWGTVGLIAALLVGAFCFWVVDRWRKRTMAARDASEELTDFRAMYERGEITEAEYVRLRDRVAQRVKEAPAAPAAAKPATPPAATEPPPPPPAGGDLPGASL